MRNPLKGLTGGMAVSVLGAFDILAIVAVIKEEAKEVSRIKNNPSSIALGGVSARLGDPKGPFC
jgi:hypothetical protein